MPTNPKAWKANDEISLALPGRVALTVDPMVKKKGADPRTILYPYPIKARATVENVP